MLRRANRWIAIRWAWLCAGIILTILLSRYEFYIRGSFQIGGEWLITPMLLVFRKAVIGLERMKRADCMERMKRQEELRKCAMQKPYRR